MVWLLTLLLALSLGAVPAYAEESTDTEEAGSTTSQGSGEDESLDELTSAVEDLVAAMSSSDDEEVSAATITDSGSSISGSAYGSVSLSDAINGLVARVPLFTDYLVVRGSAYVTYVIYGDLEVSDDVFTCEDASWYAYTTSSNTSSSSSVSYSQGSGSVSIDVSGYTVYSSLAPYPLVDSRADWCTYVILFGLCGAVTSYVFYRTWIFTQRMRGTAAIDGHS